MAIPCSKIRREETGKTVFYSAGVEISIFLSTFAPESTIAFKKFGASGRL